MIRLIDWMMDTFGMRMTQVVVVAALCLVVYVIHLLVPGF